MRKGGLDDIDLEFKSSLKGGEGNKRKHHREKLGEPTGAAEGAGRLHFRVQVSRKWSSYISSRGRVKKKS